MAVCHASFIFELGVDCAREVGMEILQATDGEAVIISRESRIFLATREANISVYTIAII